MNQAIAEGNYAAAIRNTVGKAGLKAEGLREGFPNDFKLPLYRRPQESAGSVVGESFAARELSEQVTRLSDIEQVFAYLKRQHRGILGFFRWPAGNRDC